MASFFSIATASLGFTLCLLLLISPAVSLTCTSQTLKGNKKFDKCLDLPTLDAYLHYTYNATNSSLSIAFMAPPAKPEGWVAWAINPKRQGMIGSQALVAYKSSKKVVVKTIDIASFSEITESKLSFETWDLSAEATSKGNLVIYGSMKVAEKADMLNQVWQVGSEVADGMPQKHDFQPGNMQSKDTLVLGKSAGPSSSPSPSSSSSSSPSPSSSSSSSSSSPSLAQAPETGGQAVMKSNHVGLFMGLILFISAVFVC